MSASGPEFPNPTHDGGYSLFSRDVWTRAIQALDVAAAAAWAAGRSSQMVAEAREALFQDAPKVWRTDYETVRPERGTV